MSMAEKDHEFIEDLPKVSAVFEETLDPVVLDVDYLVGLIATPVPVGWNHFEVERGVEIKKFNRFFHTIIPDSVTSFIPISAQIYFIFLYGLVSE